MNFTLLTPEAGSRPEADVLGESGPNKPKIEVSWMYILQDEKHRVEKGTDSSGEFLVPEDKENRMTRCKKWRFGETEWRRWRERGWRA